MWTGPRQFVPNERSWQKWFEGPLLWLGWKMVTGACLHPSFLMLLCASRVRNVGCWTAQMARIWSQCLANLQEKNEAFGLTTVKTDFWLWLLVSSGCLFPCQVFRGDNSPGECHQNLGETMRQRTQRCYVYISETTICIVFKLPRFGVISNTSVGNQHRKVLIKLNMSISNSPGIPLLKTYLSENMLTEDLY